MIDVMNSGASQKSINPGVLSRWFGSQWSMVFRNVLRQRSRNLLLGLLLLFSSFIIVCFSQFLAGVSVNFSKNLVTLASGDVYISSTVKRDIDRNIFGRVHKYFSLPEDFYNDLSQVDGFEHYDERLEFEVKLVTDDDSLPYQVMAFDQTNEKKLADNFTFVEGEMFKPGEYGIVLPHEYATRFNINVGDQVRLLANSADRIVNLIDYKVTGLFKTITLSAWFDNYAYLNLDIARVLIDSETALTRLNLHFKDRADLSVSSAQLNQLLKQHYTNPSQAIEITPWADGAKLFEELTQALQLSYGIIMTILIIMVSASLASSTMMHIFERTQEVATLGALGASPKKICSMLVKESLVLAVIAALIGVTIAGIVFAVTLNYGIPIHNAELKGFLGSSHFYPAFEVKGVISGLLIPLVIAFLASFIFANRSSKLPIANALADH